MNKVRRGRKYMYPSQRGNLDISCFDWFLGVWEDRDTPKKREERNSMKQKLDSGWGRKGIIRGRVVVGPKVGVR